MLNTSGVEAARFVVGAKSVSLLREFRVLGRPEDINWCSSDTVSRLV